MKQHLTQLVLALTLALPVTALAQERDEEREDRAPRERHEQTDRPERFSERGGERGDRAARGERDGERDRHDKSPKSSRLPTERIDEAITTLKELFGETPPHWLEQLERAAQERPEMVAYRLGRFPRMLDLMEMRQQRPEEFKLHIDQAHHAREIMRLNRARLIANKNGEDAKAEELRASLREKMKSVFETRLKMKRIEIEKQRQKLRKAEEELAQLEAESDRLIDQKLEEMENAGFRPGDRGEGPPRRDRDDDRPRGENR